MGRHGHHDARRVVGVDERGRQHRQRVARDRVRHLLADQRLAQERLLHVDVPALELELLGGLRGDQPGLAVDVGEHVLGLGVDEGVRDAVDRLGPERGHRDHDRAVGPAEPAGVLEPDQRVLLELRALALEQVVVGDRLALVRAEPHRVVALLEQAPLVERLVLPGDEPRVALVVRRELPAPVDRQAELPHPVLVARLGLLDEVAGVAHRRLEALEVRLGDVERPLERLHLGRVAALQALDGADDRRARDVPGDGEQHVVALEPAVARPDVRHGVGPRVADVHPARRVRVRHGDEGGLRRLVGVGLVPPRLAPARPPLLLDGRWLVVHTGPLSGAA